MDIVWTPDLEASTPPAARNLKRAATETEKTEYDLGFSSFYDGTLED
jgi:hypothetical protein